MAGGSIAPGSGHNPAAVGAIKGARACAESATEQVKVTLVTECAVEHKAVMKTASEQGLRKHPLVDNPCASVRPDSEIALRACAEFYISSEASEHPLEHLLDGHSGPGATYWSSERENIKAEILIAFDTPQRIRHLCLEAEERTRERTQEVRAEYSCDGGASFRGLFVQEYNFSPQGATFQCENLSFDLHGVTHLRLVITPNKQGSGCASLTSLRLFS
jgi:hypothetical protein